MAALAISVSALCIPAAQASSPIRFSGELSGMVTDAMGKPEPGAIVLLFNKQDRLLQRAATAADGSFSFAELLPDLYSIRVTMANLIPAAKESIQVKPGMRSLLDVSLSRIFSSVQLVSTAPAPGGLMSDSWKWTLRSDNAARPILRFAPELSASTSASSSSSADPTTRTAIFSDSRGLIRISASDGAEITGDGEADLGTEFAFATSLRGGSRVSLAGGVGYGLSGTPSAGIRTTYSRKMGSGVDPSVSVTMRQVFLPLRSQAFAANGGDSSATLRTMAVSIDEKSQLTDAISMEYGFELDQVSFLDHLHYFSPYAKVKYALEHGWLDFGWTSGNARPELGMNTADPNADLQKDLTALALLPRVSLADGRSRIERGDDYEVGLTQRFGSREYRVQGYEQHISNTALTIASPAAGLFNGDLLPDLFSDSAVFNLGSIQSFGYSASVSQDLGSDYKIALAYGSTGVLAAQGGLSTIQSADELRSMLGVSHRPAVTLRASGTVKCTGTRFIASYQWTDYHSAMPAPQMSSAAAGFEPGLNVIVRQPVPLIPGTGWRVEATAELRNLLAQGYLPLTGPGGERLLLVNMPRSLRGGLAFVF